MKRSVVNPWWTALPFALMLLAAAMLFHSEPLAGHQGRLSETTPTAQVVPVLPLKATEQNTSPLLAEVAGLAVPEKAPLGALATVASMPMGFSGRVVDESGRPIRDAFVAVLPDKDVEGIVSFLDSFEGNLAEWKQLTDPRSLTLVRTDDDGGFQISAQLERPPSAPTSTGAPAEPATPTPELIVWHRDFAPTRHWCGWLSGETHHTGDFVLTSGATVRGRCVDLQGAPLAEVTVGINLEASWSVCPDKPKSNAFTTSCGGSMPHDPTRVFLDVEDRLFMTTTDDDGQFQLTGLPPGISPVWARRPGWLLGRSRELKLVAGEDIHVGTMAMERGGHIAGQVLDATGEPVEGLTIRATPASLGSTDDIHKCWKMLTKGEAPGSIESNERIKRASVELLTTTDSDGRFSLESIDGTTVDIYSNSPLHETSSMLDVPVGTTDIILRATPTHQIDVQLVDHRGRPINALSVKISRDLQSNRLYNIDAWAARALDEEAGLWRLDDLCEHPVVLLVAVDGLGVSRLPIEHPLSLIEDGAPTQLTVPLHRRVTAHFRVPHGINTKNIQVRGTMSATSSYGSARIQEDGSFEGLLQHGQDEIVVQVPGVLDTQLSVSPEGEVSLGDVTMFAAPLIHARVTSHQGLPLKSASVMLYKAKNDRWYKVATAKTNEAGVAALTWRSSGEHRLRTSVKNDTFYCDEFEFDGQPRDLAVELRGAQPFVLRGVVSHETQPAAGATVNVAAKGKAWKVTTNDDGRFEVETSAAAPLTVTATGNDGATSSKVITVQPVIGGSQEFEIELGSAGLTGAIRWSHGAPLNPLRLLLRREGFRDVPLQLDERNGFQEQQLVPGSWTLMAVTGSTKISRETVLHSQLITVPGPPVVVAAESPAVLSLRLWDRPGSRALPDYDVVITPTDGAGRMEIEAPRPLAATLAPGDYRVQVLHREGYRSVPLTKRLITTETVHVYAGEKRQLDIVLRRP